MDRIGPYFFAQNINQGLMWCEMNNSKKNASIQCAQPQNETDYDLIRHLTDADLAWEFLRRNPYFQQDMHEMRSDLLPIKT